MRAAYFRNAMRFFFRPDGSEVPEPAHHPLGGRRFRSSRGRAQMAEDNSGPMVA
jgi:hypothetical protein